MLRTESQSSNNNSGQQQRRLRQRRGSHLPAGGAAEASQGREGRDESGTRADAAKEQAKERGIRICRTHF